MALYEMHTDRFGILLISGFSSIREARGWARRVYGVPGRGVRRSQRYRRCETCDSRPCCCDGRPS